MSQSPNQADSVVEGDERRDGVIADQGEALSLNLTEEEVVEIINSRVEDAEKWWNKELDLKNVRERTEKYYLNKPYEDSDLHDHQTPYKNNRIITAVETLVPMVTSQAAEPTVTEAQDTDESRQLAQDYQNVLMAMYEDLEIKRKLAIIARHLLTGKRVGVLKYWFDPNKGAMKPDGTRRGKIRVEVVRPEKIVFEQEASDPDNIPLVCEYLTGTIEELVLKFPKKKAEIYKEFNVNEKSSQKQLQKIVGYQEVWFTYYDKEGQAQEAVCWKVKKLILDMIQNPNWNYDEYETDPETGNMVNLNFLESPAKPYVIFNHLNLGKYLLDDTSLAEQSIYLQDVLNKRGRQVVDNADQATSGMVFNSEMISPDDAARLIGDPSEKIMVDGDVRAAATRLPINQLPQYVLEDKYDARSEIDNLFGANAPIRGESSGIKTLGQEIISQRANMGRLQSFAESIENGMTRLYCGITQIIKVNWDETEVIRFRQSAGKTRFIDWDRNKIEDGVQVRVKAGSALAKDKMAVKNETLQIAPLLDPLTLAEGLDYENPREIAQRMTYYRFFMDKYMTEFLDGAKEGVDKTAMTDIQLLIAGEMPEPPENPTQEYLATFEYFLESQAFKMLNDEIKQRVIEFVKSVNETAKAGIGEQPASEEPSVEEQPLAQDQGMGTEAPPVETQAPPADAEQNILQRGMSALMNRFTGA